MDLWRERLSFLVVGILVGLVGTTTYWCSEIQAGVDAPVDGGR